MRHKNFWFSSKHYFPKERWFNHKIAMRICCYQEFNYFGFYTSICKLQMDSQESGPTSEICRKNSHDARKVWKKNNRDKALWSKCPRCIRKGWNIPRAWSHAAPDPHWLTTTCSNTLTSNLDIWSVRLVLPARKGAAPRQLVPVLLKLAMETALMGCSTSSKPWHPSPSGMGKRNGSLQDLCDNPSLFEDFCSFLCLKCPNRD